MASRRRGWSYGAVGLVHLSIPDDAIVPIPEISDSTYEEALHSREIMQAHGWHSAILVTDPFHMRRAILTFRAAFEPTGLTVLASPADGSKYGVANWWTDRNAIMRVAQEYLKLRVLRGARPALQRRHSVRRGQSVISWVQAAGRFGQQEQTASATSSGARNLPPLAMPAPRGYGCRSRSGCRRARWWRT